MERLPLVWCQSLSQDQQRCPRLLLPNIDSLAAIHSVRGNVEPKIWTTIKANLRLKIQTISKSLQTANVYFCSQNNNVSFWHRRRRLRQKPSRCNKLQIKAKWRPGLKSIFDPEMWYLQNNKHRGEKQIEHRQVAAEDMCIRKNMWVLKLQFKATIADRVIIGKQGFWGF